MPMAKHVQEVTQAPYTQPTRDELMSDRVAIRDKGDLKLGKLYFHNHNLWVGIPRSMLRELGMLENREAMLWQMRGVTRLARVDFFWAYLLNERIAQYQIDHVWNKKMTISYGGSGLLLPKQMVKEMGLRKGMPTHVELAEDHLVLKFGKEVTGGNQTSDAD